MRKTRLGLLAALLCAEAVGIAVLLPVHRHAHVLLLEAVTTPIFLAAVAVLSRLHLTPRSTAALIIGVGIVFQALAMLAPAQASDDYYRYVWDGKVQLAGIDPYRYAPTAPELAHLRDGFLFPDRAACAWPVPDGCSAINRPNVHTVYPPVAEAAFSAIRVASFGGHGNRLPVQLAAALGTIAVMYLLCRYRSAHDRPLWTVALWAWCPVTVVEFGNGGHIDWLAALLGLLAIGAGAAGRPGRAGVLAGAAIAAKLYPALLLPSLLKRRPLVVLAAAAGAVTVSYLPHVLAVGGKVLGYLRGYVGEERYSDGTRFLLLEPLLPARAATVVAAAILVLTALWAVRRTDALRPEDTALVMTGVAILVTTPKFGWYSGLLLALIAMAGRPAWLPVALAPSLAYLLRGAYPLPPAAARAIYAAALVVTVACVARPQPVGPSERVTSLRQLSTVMHGGSGATPPRQDGA